MRAQSATNKVGGEFSAPRRLGFVLDITDCEKGLGAGFLFPVWRRAFKMCRKARSL